MPLDIQNDGDAMADDNVGTPIPIYDRKRVPVLDSQDNPTTITVVGLYSDRVKEATRAQEHRRRERAGRPRTEQEELSDRVEIAVAGIMGWAGIEENKQPVAFSKEKAVLLLTRVPWVLEQVEVGISDYARFFVKPSAS